MSQPTPTRALTGAQVFISYATEDREKARSIAEILIHHGLSVWWDRKVPLGTTYRDRIEAALAEARCVVVLWSHRAVSSHWVIDEAQAGLDRGILVPALLEPVPAPLGFRALEAARLWDWRGGDDHPEIKKLVRHVAELAGAALPDGARMSDTRRRKGWAVRVAVATMIAALLAFTAGPLLLELGAKRAPAPADRGKVVINSGGDIAGQPADTNRQGASTSGTGFSAEELAAKGHAAWKGRRFADAVARFPEACDLGSAQSCLLAGQFYSNGWGGFPIDLTRAADLFRRACDRRDAEGCWNLGFMNEQGQGGLAANFTRAVELYRKACDAGFSTGCQSLGSAYEHGQGGLHVDMVKAIALYRKACDEGNNFTCALLNLDYEVAEGAYTIDAKTAEPYRRGCATGTAFDCTRLGIAYYKGGDEKQAQTLYRHACGLGDTLGCWRLGFPYQRDKGLDADPAKAVILYRRDCNAGDALGCSYLGVAYDRGQGGLDINPTKAVELYRKACDAGVAMGCSSLGVKYETGLGGLPADPAAAADLYRAGCAAGYARGCTYLGNMYASGNGVPKDTAKATELYKKGCDGDDSPACEALEH